MFATIVICISALTASLYADSTLVSGLVAKYSFQGNMHDESGNNHDARPIGDCQYISGGGININNSGSGGYISVPIAQMSLSDSYTISISTRNVAYTSYEPIVFWGDETNGYPNLRLIQASGSNIDYLHASHYLRGDTYWINPEGGHGFTTSNQLDFREVHQFIITKSANAFSFYVDGDLVGTGNNTTALPSQNNLYLGAHTWGNESALSSNMQATFLGLEIYNRGLTNTEVQSITTVPEPSALSLLAIGLGGLALVRRRRS
jgi:Concanavalin A-like lectin/glucanases superfamily/PEP-CTERM motif